MSVSPQAELLPRIAGQVVEIVGRGGGPLDASRVDWREFERLAALIRPSFIVPSTTITPVMARVLFALGAARAPRAVLGIGTYVGYGFAWLLGRDRGLGARSAVGIDVDAVANTIARHNLALLGYGDRLRIIDGDGIALAPQHASDAELLFVDLDDPTTGKTGYRDVLSGVVEDLPPGALVLAHDPSVPKFSDAFRFYVDYARESGRLARDWVFPIDDCGLSVLLLR